MKKVLNSKGISLVGVIIAAGLVSGLFLAVGKMMQNSNKVVRTTQVGLEALDFEALLEDTFRNRDACTNTFGRVFDLTTPTTELRAGLSIDGNNILDNNTFDSKKGVFNASRDILWSKDELVIGGLELESITMPVNRIKPDGTTDINFIKISDIPKTGAIELHVKLKKTKQAEKTFGARDKVLKLFLTAEMYDDGGTDRISWCQLSGSQAEASLSLKRRMIIWKTPGNHGTGSTNAINYEVDISSKGQVEGSVTMVGYHKDNLEFFFDAESGIFTYLRTGYHCDRSGSSNIKNTDLTVISDYANCGNPNPNVYARYTVRYDANSNKLQFVLSRDYYGTGPTYIKLLINE
ncbi:MAG: hypothetical protein ACPGJV_00200 [Bacteriovoracaceae bacterium]